MNKDLSARLACYRKVQQVLADYATAGAEVPAFARLAARYQLRLGRLDGSARRKGVPSDGATLTKSRVGSATGLLPTLALLTSLAICPFAGWSQGKTTTIAYATPTKQLTMSVTYSLIMQKTYTKYVPATKTPASLKTTKLLSAAIDNNTDIKVVPSVRADPTSKFLLTLPLGASGKRSVKCVFETENPLLLQTINCEYTPMTVEVITGVANSLGAVLSIVSKAIPFAGMPTRAPVTDSVVIEKVKFTSQHDVTPSAASQSPASRVTATTTVKLQNLLASTILGANPAALPEVVFKAEPDATNFSGVTSLPQGGGTGSSTLYYRNPAYYTITVSITNNGPVKNQTVSVGYVSLPQFGTWESIDLSSAFKGGKKTVGLKLNNSVGGLMEYSSDRESILGATLSAGATGLDKVGEGIDKIKGSEAAQYDSATKREQSRAAYFKAKKEAAEAEAAAAKAGQ